MFNKIFSLLFDIETKESNLINSEEQKIIDKLLEENPYYINIIPPAIKIHNWSNTGNGGFSTCSQVKLFFIKNEFEKSSEFYQFTLKHKHNPLYIVDYDHQLVYSPFCFQKEDNYHKKINLLYDDIEISNDIRHLQNCPIVNLQLSSGTLDISEIENEIYFFCIQFKNKLIIVNIKEAISIFTNGSHFINDKPIEIKHSINGSFLFYSIYREYKKFHVKENLRIQYGIFDLYKAKLVLCRHSHNDLPHTTWDDYKTSI